MEGRFQFSKRKVAIFLHLAFWLIVFFLPYFLRQSMDENRRFFINTGMELHGFINLLTFVVLFYVNAYVLLPKYYFRKRYAAYFISVLLLLLLLFVFNYVSFRILVSEKTFMFSGFLRFYFFPCLFVLATSTAFKMLQDRLETDKKQAQKETVNLKTELAFLRSQVSPHFMFNVLNSMVALARKKSDKLEPSLIKLSSLLRYMLYETHEEKVPLEKEIDYLRSYIDLQQQRFQNQVKVHDCMNEVDMSYEIAPMLLIPFVENAFKHGTGFLKDAEISIILKAKSGKLHFGVTNKYIRQTEDEQAKNSGIGLNNVMRRLNLIYKDQHELVILEEDGIYTVSLEINLT